MIMISIIYVRRIMDEIAVCLEKIWHTVELLRNGQVTYRFFYTHAQPNRHLTTIFTIFLKDWIVISVRQLGSNKLP